MLFFAVALQLLIITAEKPPLPIENDILKSSNLNAFSLEDLLNIEIITASNKAEKSSDAPGTVIIVTADDILNRGYNDLADLLRDLPGIDLVEHAGRFGELVTIRGIEGNDRFLVLINGHRINSP
ncbi:MAG: TonB-dependent receptor plug domain-containing protein [Deltaproteobacteria bacterium]|nr:TonB-dependent receptor plug domain-containing protein [Deltaproteobacteria bacterium]